MYIIKGRKLLIGRFYLLQNLMGKVKNLIAWWLAVLWSIVPWQAMNTPKIQTQQEKTSTEIAAVLSETKNNNTFEIWIDTINHEEFIHKNISEIFDEYGEEEWLLLINQHLLIELNKIRVQNWAKELVLDNQIIQLAQKQAIHLDSLDKIFHENFWDRLDANNIEYNSYWENLWLWQTNIDEVVEDRMKSPGHRANILKRSFKKMWVWVVYNKGWNVWVLNRIW